MKRDALPDLHALQSPEAAVPGASPVPVAVAWGDGIGPEIMDATLRVLAAAGASIAPQRIEIGEAVYRAGHSAGIAPDSWDVLRGTRVMLKAPITTPSGGGFKSLNVTLRKTLGLFANVRPCTAHAPWVPTPHPKMDVVIVRENEEDLYAGIEHRQTAEVFQCLKLVSRPGCERIVRHAFDYARANGRRKVTCMVKDNIMKLTDGLFAQVFEEIGAEYPDIEKERMIVDIGAARLATRPERFDVIVMPNLYGDILSDIAAEVAGSVGLAGSANIGQHAAMFEAIHGSAPDIAGRDLANPSGLLQAAVMMLVHIGQPEVAARIRNAWLRTLEDGVHTADISGSATRRTVGTAGFAQAVIDRLGELPREQPPASFAAATPASAPLAASAGPAASVASVAVAATATTMTTTTVLPARAAHASRPIKRTVGVDVFLDAPGVMPDALAASIESAGTGTLKLSMITNRGVKVWPKGLPETFCTDHWRCRFVKGESGVTGHSSAAGESAASVEPADIIALLARLVDAGLDPIKTENLCSFDGEPGFSLGQGQ